MAIQVINDPYRSLSASLGSAAGSGLADVLNILAQNKLNDIQERQIQRRGSSTIRNALSNLSEGEANFLAQYPQLIPAYLEKLGASQTTTNFEPGEQESGLRQLTQPQQAQQPFLPEQQNINDLLQQPQVSPAVQQAAVRGLTPAQQQQLAEQQPQSAFDQTLQRGIAQQLAQQGAHAQQQQLAPVIQTPLAQGPQTLAQVLAQPSKAERAAQAKETAARFKETKAERKEIVEKARTAKRNIHDLERLEELEKEGKLDTPGYVEFLQRSGLDIPALLNPGSEEFNKISANFIRDAKTYFGSRVSNFEIEQFLKTIPSLSQSPEGRKRVIANLKNLNRGALEYNNAYKEVLSENRGVPPYDLLEQVDAKAEKKEDKLAALFKKDLAKPVPAGQNKYITGLQSVLGTVAGRLPKAATGALLGAAAGARLGLPGGPLGGAALGGLAGLGGVSIKDILGF